MRIKKNIPLSIIVALPLFLLNEIALLAVTFASLILWVKRRPFEILLIISFYLSFQWAFGAISASLLPELLASRYIKTILGAVFFFVLALKFTGRIKRAQLLCAITLGALCVKGVLFAGDKEVALKYIVNMYIPLIAMVVIISAGRVEDGYKVNHALRFYLVTIIAISIAGSVMHKLSAYESLLFFTSEIAQARQDTDNLSAFIDGEYKWLSTGIFTKVAGISVIRNPGFIIDSILAGYLFAFASIYILYFVKEWKSPLLAASLVLLLITYSKGAWLIFVMTIAIAEINKLVWDLSTKKKFLLNMVIVSFAVCGVMYLAGNSGDSSQIHYLGLTQVFNQNASLFGHDLGSGGNYAGIEFAEKLKRGAESTIGVVFYHTGLLGLLSFVLLNIATLQVLLRSNNRNNSILVAVLSTQFVACFLQENTYNLSYVLPRIAIVLAIIYSLKKQECQNTLNRC